MASSPRRTSHAGVPPPFVTLKIHLNAAASRVCAAGGGDGWVHLVRDNPVPPTGAGSYNHLLWQILEARDGADIVIVDYDRDSFALAERSPVPVVQIERSSPRRIVTTGRRLRMRLAGTSPLGRYAVQNRDFTQAAAQVIRDSRAEKVLIWGIMPLAPLMRRSLPDHFIAFAQRHYEYPPNQSHYASCDAVVMQTRGQVSVAFERLPHLSPFVTVIPNGVELDAFEPASPAQREAARQKFGIPMDRFTVVFPSKLAPYKGTSYLLQWIRDFGLHRPDVHFLVVGTFHHRISTRERAQLEDELTARGNVCWLRGVSRQDMPSVFHASDICLMPALWREGFSMAATEAMASGLPLVASAAGSYREIVKDGYNGLLCPQNDLFRTARDAIASLADDVGCRAMLGTNARRYAVERLSRAKVVSNFVAFLEDRYDDIDEDLSFSDEISRRVCE